MKPDHLRQLLAASYPALARINSGQPWNVPSQWRELPRLNLISRSVMVEHRYPSAQDEADDAAAKAEERFDSFRAVCSAVNSAYRQALAHHRLEQALEQLRIQARA